MEKGNNLHIAVSGNIGSGKTTLTGLLSKHYGWQAHFEDADDNPYINDFYAEMQRWSFNMQIYFLNNRFNQVLEIREGKKCGHSRSNHLRGCLHFCAQLAQHGINDN